VGRVTHVERGGRMKPVRGGRRGLLQVRLSHLRRRLRWRGRQVAAHLGRRFYRWLRNSGLVPRLWQPTITRVHVETEAGLVVKYIHRQRTVARWWPETAKFQCRKPYDLVISRPANGPSEKEPAPDVPVRG
jgi:hypothetical protein